MSIAVGSPGLKWTKKQLLKLPDAEWGGPERWWRALLIVPTRKKHDSGWSHIAIIGVNAEHQAELILAYPDDIAFPALCEPRGYNPIRMDSYHPQGVLRMWSSSYDFAIDYPTSSVDIQVRRIEK